MIFNLICFNVHIRSLDDSEKLRRKYAKAKKEFEEKVHDTVEVLCTQIPL